MSDFWYFIKIFLLSMKKNENFEPCNSLNFDIFIDLFWILMLDIPWRDHLWDTSRDLAPFVQFKKREKHPWKRVTLVELKAKAWNFTKNNTPPWVFFTFLNCTNRTNHAKHYIWVSVIIVS